MINLDRNVRRREAVRALAQQGFNGIDYLDVVDPHTLHVYFINPLQATDLDKYNVSITGGERIRDVVVMSVRVSGERLLAVKVNKPGDSTNYTLSLQADSGRLKLDPQFSSIDFTFKHSDRDDFDLPVGNGMQAGENGLPTPLIDYLSKDYASFRLLMLDRLSTLIPLRDERSEADIGVMLVEALAYVADHLSYQQDVIATESYLSTARRRISVRRHARLLNYFINEGCNARVWVQIQVSQDIVRGREDVLPKGTKLFTQIPGQENIILDTLTAVQAAINGQAEMFETTYTLHGLYVEHNEMPFYSWGAGESWLPQGATSATLRGSFQNLHPGDVLIFKEVLDAATGLPQNADFAHCHPVRLTKIRHEKDPLGEWLAERKGKSVASLADTTTPDTEGEHEEHHRHTGSDYAMEITEIEWQDEDALPFPLCLSTTVGCEDGSSLFRDVSVALGNIVLADYGCTVEEPHFATVPVNTAGAQPTIARFNPTLQYPPLTFAAPYDGKAANQSAGAAMQYTSHDAVPAITLSSRGRGEAHNQQVIWHTRYDLLECTPFDPHFVVEIDDDGIAYLRFGDDQYGMCPAPGTIFSATYRVGNGVRGNIGSGTLYHIASASPDRRIDPYIVGVDNPMAASGGVDPQSIDDVRQNIAWSFNTQQRGVTPDDYKTLAEAAPGVERARAIMYWTGSWYTVLLTVERSAKLPVDDDFRSALRTYMEPYRMAGTDLQVVPPVYVSLEIGMTVLVAPTYLRSTVRNALLEVFSNRQWPDGRRGIFYPGNYTFGQPVYLSELYAAAYGVAGTQQVTISTFQRQGVPGPGLQDGVLPMEWLEIARLENDPNYPEQGILRLQVEGGK